MSAVAKSHLLERFRSSLSLDPKQAASNITIAREGHRTEPDVDFGMAEALPSPLDS